MTKRASPGADTEKSPFADYETRDEDIVKLKDLQEQDERKQLASGMSDASFPWNTRTEMSPFCTQSYTT